MWGHSWSVVPPACLATDMQTVSFVFHQFLWSCGCNCVQWTPASPSSTHRMSQWCASWSRVQLSLYDTRQQSWDKTLSNGRLACQKGNQKSGCPPKCLHDVRWGWLPSKQATGMTGVTVFWLPTAWTGSFLMRCPCGMKTKIWGKLLKFLNLPATPLSMQWWVRFVAEVCAIWKKDIAKQSLPYDWGMEDIRYLILMAGHKEARRSYLVPLAGRVDKEDPQPSTKTANTAWYYSKFTMDTNESSIKGVLDRISFVQFA